MAEPSRRTDHDDSDAALMHQASTFTTSYVSPSRSTPVTGLSGYNDIVWHQTNGFENPLQLGKMQPSVRSFELGSTGKGILIGMLSAFGSAALVCLMIAAAYFFRYTQRGRIFLDRISRPGEFDDEQQFLREEEDAVAHMDEIHRAEYLRAKGMCPLRMDTAEVYDKKISNDEFL